MKNFIVGIFFLFMLASCTNSPGQWESLIKDNLNNWTELNGTAPFTLKDSIITGSAKFERSSSFLCTKKNYGDFILEFDALIDPRMNSGVQIRSKSTPNYRNGKVHGYQVELESSPRRWSGGIFDEGRRNWIYTLEDNPEGKKAFKINEWNHVRVEAFGNSIRTWINGIPCADLVDDMSSEGFIGLQVHEIYDTSKAGITAKWKNMRIITNNVENYLTPYEPVIVQKSFLVNKLTKREIDDGWKLLWDGKSTAGWTGNGLSGFPSKRWNIKNNALSIIEKNDNENDNLCDLISEGKYKNFELTIDFCYSKGANSGIKYLINTQDIKENKSSPGLEYQIIDNNINHKGGKRSSGTHNMAALYDILAPQIRSDLGPEKWNRATIIVKGKHVEHYLNERKVLEFDRSGDDWKEFVKKSIFKDYPHFGEAETGHILLKDNGSKVSFRSIKIKETE